MRAPLTTIRYPVGLPISDRRDDLLTAIGEHQVVIVAGETGSGKSTQLPKFCLELGRGVAGVIGHTQPRRIAARTIAERVAEELGCELGTTVGYAVRFTDRVGPDTMVKVMTDGILLAEIQQDRTLSKYDTLIIDEAHERSLNIDFLLGYLHQLLPRRPDLKLIVTSATIDTGRFSAHFHDAPIIEVTGRTFPVEQRYRPLGDEASDDRDQVQAICDAVDELEEEGPGDMLVFLSGEREIHDAADALRRLERPGLEVLALYARLSAAEQHRIFSSHKGRRVVLSTNVAETSLTVPGIRYVIDTGVARMSRYSHRLKVQRLPIEPISQASANQRAGRCGRVAPGICIRLYGEDDFLGRDEFTEPEILRTNLASVILQMTALGLGDVSAFPFLDPPDSRAVNDGVALLEELGALDPDAPAERRRLTPLGRRLARLPVDPRFGRMVLEADRHNCVREVMVIAAALSIQDPRERPSDKQQAADEAHAKFNVVGSDFLSYVALWDYLRAQQQQLSTSQFRKLCRTEFLNYLRVREWQDVYSQLRQVTGSLGVRAGTEVGHPDRVHQSLLAGLLSHLGMRDGISREFRGARNSRFAIVPRSALAKKPPQWIMASELVETNRLWARVVGQVQPEWAEELAPHLVKRSYGDPVWDERSGRAVTTERVTLYGLPLVAARRIGYDRVNKADARDMFVHHALVDGEWTTRHTFVEQNKAFVDEIRGLADRVRRGDLIDDQTVFDFYDKRVGADVVSSRHFDQWWKRERAKNPDLLRLTTDVLRPGGGPLNTNDYPDVWQYDDLILDISYRFDPGQPGDGVTVHVPLAVLNRVDGQGFDWQVPGIREELVDALIRSLPKQYRRVLSPLTDTSRAAYLRLSQTTAPLATELARIVSDVGGETVPARAFDLAALPSHLRITFSIDDDDGNCVATGTDLAALRKLLSGRLRAAIADTTPDLERVGLTSWSFGALPTVVETDRGGNTVRGYPALVDDGGSVSIRVFTNPDIQGRLMRTGVRRLLLLSASVPRKLVERSLSNAERLAIGGHAVTSLSELVDDCIVAAADRIVVTHGIPWDEAGFASLQAAARDELTDQTANLVKLVGQIMEVVAAIDRHSDRLVAPVIRPSVDDTRAQLARLIRPGFVTAAGADRVPDVVRYVKAIERRLDKMAADLGKDQARMRDVQALESRYGALLKRLPRAQITQEVIDIGWMIEEFRVSVFAQAVGTKGPVSATRIKRDIDRF